MGDPKVRDLEGALPGRASIRPLRTRPDGPYIAAMNALRTRLTLMAWPVLFVFLIAGIWLTPWRDWVEPLQLWIENHTRVGWLVYLLIYVIVVALPLPAAAMSIVGGLAFGWWAIPLALLGSLLGSLGPWWATRRFLRVPVMTRLGGPRVRAADAMVRDDAFVFVTLLRLTPILPFTVQNYLLGLTSVALGPFVVATIAGLAPSTIALVWIGEVGSLTFTGATPGQIASLIAGLAVFAGFLGWAIWRAMARAAGGWISRLTPTEPQGSGRCTGRFEVRTGQANGEPIDAIPDTRLAVRTVSTVVRLR